MHLTGPKIQLLVSTWVSKFLLKRFVKPGLSTVLSELGLNLGLVGSLRMRHTTRKEPNSNGVFSIRYDTASGSVHIAFWKVEEWVMHLPEMMRKKYFLMHDSCGVRIWKKHPSLLLAAALRLLPRFILKITAFQLNIKASNWKSLLKSAIAQWPPFCFNSTTPKQQPMVWTACA